MLHASCLCVKRVEAWIELTYEPNTTCHKDLAALHSTAYVHAACYIKTCLLTRNDQKILLLLLQGADTKIWGAVLPKPRIRVFPQQFSNLSVCSLLAEIGQYGMLSELQNFSCMIPPLRRGDPLRFRNEGPPILRNEGTRHLESQDSSGTSTEMSAVRSFSATSILQSSAKSSASRAAPRALDQQRLQCRSLAGKNRAFSSGTSSIKPRKAASILTLICAVRSTPGRAYASAMTSSKSATFAAVSLTIVCNICQCA